MKNVRGITLVALVITIIVLLILAGITISLTLGDRGIFKMAQTAGKNYIDAQEKEFVDLDKLYSSIKVATDGTVTLDMEQLNNIIERKVQEELQNASVNSVNYSSDAQLIGTWIDGKKLYRKVFKSTSAITANTWTTIGSLDDVSEVCNITGAIRISDASAWRNLIGYNSSEMCVDVNIGSGVVNVRSSGTWASPLYYIIIEYTKKAE